MKKMKLVSTLLFVISLLVFNGCKKEEASILGSMEITVGTSETYTGVNVGNLEVILTNTNDNSVAKATTDASGKAVFLELAPGTYNISSSKLLSPTEAFEFTGLNKELTLNATLSNVTLLPMENKTSTITLDGKAGGSLVIKEVYSVGASNDGYAIMFKDQFIEIFNNSDEVQYLDGLYLAYLAPQRCGSSPAQEPVTTLPIGEYVYASKVLQFPGTGTQYPIQPGQGKVVALNAVNYLESKPLALTVDNSKADFDMYAIDWLQSLGRTGNSFFDLDNPDVPTMKGIYLFVQNGGFFNLDTAPSVALCKLDADPTTTVKEPDLTAVLYYLKIPSASIIDGIDILDNKAASVYKRLPSSIDAGYYFALENGKSSYTGKSIRRKIAKTLSNGRNVLMDTNNSSTDLEVVAPATPHSYNMK